MFNAGRGGRGEERGDARIKALMTGKMSHRREERSAVTEWLIYGHTFPQNYQLSLYHRSPPQLHYTGPNRSQTETLNRQDSGGDLRIPRSGFCVDQPERVVGKTSVSRATVLSLGYEETLERALRRGMTGLKAFHCQTARPQRAARCQSRCRGLTWHRCLSKRRL